MKKTHIEKLSDRINGGDDVDAAAELQEIAEDLLAILKTWSMVAPMPRQLVGRIQDAIKKGNGLL